MVQACIYDADACNEDLVSRTKDIDVAERDTRETKWKDPQDLCSRAEDLDQATRDTFDARTGTHEDFLHVKDDSASRNEDLVRYDEDLGPNRDHSLEISTGMVAKMNELKWTLRKRGLLTER